MSKPTAASTPRGNSLGGTGASVGNGGANKGPASKFGRSVRSKRTLTNFRPSLRGDSSSGSDYSPSDSDSSQGSNNSPGSPMKKPTTRRSSKIPPPSASKRLSYQDRPSFKRRSKRESGGSGINLGRNNSNTGMDEPAKPQQQQEDHWSSFLKDLAAAEEKFFTPAHSQRSAILRYEGSDEEADPQIPAIKK